MPDEFLFKVLGGILGIFLLLLLAQTFGTPALRLEYTKELDDLTTLVWRVCTNDLLEFVLLGLELLMLFGGTYLAIVTRHVKEDYNESQSLGISIYNALFLLVVTVVVDTIAANTPETKDHMIHFLRVALTSTAVVAIMCITKLIKNNGQSQPGLSSTTGQAKIAPPTSGAGIISGTNFQSGHSESAVQEKLSAALKRNQELENMVAELERKTRELSLNQHILNEDNKKIVAPWTNATE
ncbi:hypothetical protein HK102_014161 [Quaeritorhiza haematococci]|nr:hypothetical protein HK102_014161 [Quaeritorhiza haematococci]